LKIDKINHFRLESELLISSQKHFQVIFARSIGHDSLAVLLRVFQRSKSIPFWNWSDWRIADFENVLDVHRSWLRYAKFS
jgi:hypothetical protein